MMICVLADTRLVLFRLRREDDPLRNLELSDFRGPDRDPEPVRDLENGREVQTDYPESRRADLVLAKLPEVKKLSVTPVRDGPLIVTPLTILPLVALKAYVAILGPLLIKLPGEDLDQFFSSSGSPKLCRVKAFIKYVTSRFARLILSKRSAGKCFSNTLR